MNSPQITAARPFLTADWHHLIMLNYEVDPTMLHKFVPRGTELDHWNGRVFMSLVGFRFLNTKVLGIPIPFHRNFEEVNLRFYVRRVEADTIKRGVVFIREIVPRRAIATLAKFLYNEPYIALPMQYHTHSDEGSRLSVSYSWTLKTGVNKIAVTVGGNPRTPDPNSQEQFITEHYWGYTAQPDGGSIEYRVAHPSWRVWNARNAVFEGDATGLYGKEFAQALKKEPSSAFLAEGSEVTVSRGQRL